MNEKGLYNFQINRKNENGEIKIINKDIEIIFSNFRKPKLGGFKEKNLGKNYYHCFTQTDQIKIELVRKLHRNTQTYEINSKNNNTNREFGTQVERRGIWIDKRFDKLMAPKKYFTSEMWLKQRELSINFIQKMLRGWIARKKTFKLKQEKEKIKEEQLNKERQFRKEEEEKHELEIKRRIHPTKKEDFEILYEELELWRINETNKIKNNNKLDDIKKQEMLKKLLEKEIELLQTIDRLKIEAVKENKQKKIETFLKALTAPKRWKRSDGRTTLVNTPNTFRNEELWLVYEGLKRTDISLDERLDILMNAKFTLFENPSDITFEIEELINREADMINRGRPVKSLIGLRQRLTNLFLQFIQNPKKNPEAAKLNKIPLELLNNK